LTDLRDKFNSKIETMAKPEQLINQQRARQNRYFSEGFKRQKVEDIEKNIVRISEICREYQVSNTAVYKWIYKYSSMRKKGIRQVVETESDTRKLHLLKEKIKELERIIGQKQIVIDFQDKMIDIAEVEYKVDIKKKLGSKLSAGSGSTGTNTITE
jgi:transposase-like protein